MPSAYAILKLWAVGPDDDWFRYVCAEYGLTKPEARRLVKQAHHVYGFAPTTSREHAEVRERIVKGRWFADELV